MENKNIDELGYAGGETVNLKSVFGRIRQKTGEIAEASKKLATDVGEVIKNSVKDNASEDIEIKPAEVAPDPGEEEHIVITSEPPQPEKKEIEEISLDLDDMKSQISQAVRNAIQISNDDITKLVASADHVAAELENVKIRLEAIQHSTEDGMHDNSNSIASLKKTIGELKERILEISQTISGVSKVSDSVFDLKNAQINTKKSIDSLETAIKLMKKKLNASVAVLCIIGVLIIALQVITILS